jgi:hypothetical protein
MWRWWQRQITAAHVDNDNRDEDAGRLTPDQRRTCRACLGWAPAGHTDTDLHQRMTAMAERMAAARKRRAELAAARAPQTEGANP